MVELAGTDKAAAFPIDGANAMAGMAALARIHFFQPLCFLIATELAAKQRGPDRISDMGYSPGLPAGNSQTGHHINYR